MQRSSDLSFGVVKFHLCFTFEGKNSFMSLLILGALVLLNPTIFPVKVNTCLKDVNQGTKILA